jgi:HEPN domain-containing protein
VGAAERLELKVTMPKSSRDFLNAARQRLSTAEFLVEWDYNLDGMYLAGYAIECSLKALILHSCSQAEYDELHSKITSGGKMHDAEILGDILKTRGFPIPFEIVTKLRQQRYKWSVNLRYETGRKNSGETRGFLKLAKATYNWVEEQLK